MKALFITDFGTNLAITDAETGEAQGQLARYAAWGDKGRGKPEVIETSDDLDQLQEKHGPGLPVQEIGGAK